MDVSVFSLWKYIDLIGRGGVTWFGPPIRSMHLEGQVCCRALQPLDSFYHDLYHSVTSQHFHYHSPYYPATSHHSLTSLPPSFLCVTSRNDVNVFWNQVFFEACISVRAAFSWCVRSCVLHSDSTRANLVCANSSSSSRIWPSASTIWGLRSDSLFRDAIFLNLPSGLTRFEHFSQSWICV